MDTVEIIIELLRTTFFAGALTISTAWYVSRKKNASYESIINRLDNNKRTISDLIGRVVHLEYEIENIKNRLNALEDK